MIDWEELSQSVVCNICMFYPYKGDENYKPSTWKSFLKIIIVFAILVAIMSIAALIVN